MAGSFVLHGTLDIHIKKAEDLHNKENLGLGLLGRGIAKIAKLKVDAYCNVKLAGLKVATTAVQDETTYPIWDEHFSIPLCHSGVNEVLFEIKDKNQAGSTFLGSAALPINNLLQAPDGLVDTVFKIQVPGKHHHKGRLYVAIQYNRYVPGSPSSNSPETPGTYWAAQPGNIIRLYQSAHNTPETLLPYTLPSWGVLAARGCWQDVTDAISGAERFVYLTGWSLRATTRLLRPAGASIGELLKAASERGVQIKLLIWDDRSSMNVSVPGLKALARKGVMNTFDEETRQWFAANAPLVECELVGRSGGPSNSILEGQAAATFFSHHQKTIMCDVATDDGSGAREVVAFLGGLDITKGRWDTAAKPLFAASDPCFADDYKQSSFDPEEGARPRQPWQDIHCRIQGPAADNVVANFVERWAKAVKRDCSPSAALGCAAVDRTGAPGAAAVQVLRSIDARDAVLDTDGGWGTLFSKKGRAVDHSIMLAYIHHIRRAQRFVYIENQYFLGSCYMWSDGGDSGCSHTVPAELTAKICAKIAAGEPFHAYIVIPLFPEGDPYADSVQAVLRFQALTIAAMFAHIGAALRAGGGPPGRSPTDFVTFLCLGQRAAGPRGLPPARPSSFGGGSSDGEGRDDVVQGELSRCNRRFMIYVHSKLMIVDDEVALVGSANINMRSLAGTRDSEIAAAIWQPPPGGQATGRPTAAGDVHGFRMLLWQEHLAAASPEDRQLFLAPEQPACVRRVQQMAQESWDAYVGEENVDLQNHLMLYPLRPSHGQLAVEPVVPCIPDFPGASFLGSQTNLPHVLTT